MKDLLADIDKSEVEEVEDVKVATKQPKQKQTKIQFETKKQLKEDLADKNNKSEKKRSKIVKDLD